MQLAVIELARNVAGLKDAHSEEFCTEESHTLEHHIVKLANVKNADLGGTMRLGAYNFNIAADSKIMSAYKNATISERHRHRYIINSDYKDNLEKNGLICSGISEDGTFIETVELKDHPWFIGVQFHPELKSKPFSPHPLFVSFIKAAVDKKIKT
ncbi:MAG: CTP synthase [Wolbachia endosymbiont of Ctenocephalides orientis wCori]|nr:MAG: CTP synthase [Wolbachia endosymbiont of Ctenocephalides orientis wCori]